MLGQLGSHNGCTVIAVLSVTISVVIVPHSHVREVSVQPVVFRIYGSYPLAVQCSTMQHSAVQFMCCTLAAERLNARRNYGWRSERISDGCYVIRTSCSTVRATAGKGAGDVSGAAQRGK